MSDSETEVLGNCKDCGTDIFDDGEDELWCDECSYRLCHGCNRRCEGCSRRVCDEHRCSDECCDGAYCEECHKEEEYLKAEGDSGCCICGADYGRYGHNPDPVKSSGRCCDTCNATVVIPARLSMMGFRSEEDEIMAQMYEIEDKANPSAEDLKNYANLETRMYELTRMSSEYVEDDWGWDGGHGEEYCHICMSVDEPIMSDEWCDGCEMALCDGCFGDPLQETCQSCRELDELEMASEDNTPIMPPMDFGDMVNWRPLDGTPGLKRNRAEGVTEEVTNRLQRMALGFTGMTVVFTAVGAIGGYLLGRNTKR